jgi:hypothetical protein
MYWFNKDSIGWYSFNLRECYITCLFEVKKKKRKIYFVFHTVCFFCVTFSGLRRGVICVFNAFRARRFVREHRLQLDQASHHGGIGIALPEEPKDGIPHGCGFEFPILSLIFIANLISLIYWTRTFEEKI